MLVEGCTGAIDGVLLEWAWSAGSVEPVQRAPNWVMMMELVLSVEAPARASAPVWTMSWRPLRLSRRAA